jgi:kynurenine formamidase
MAAELLLQFVAAIADGRTRVVLSVTDAILITPPLKIEKGSGSPLRVLALVA